MRCLGPWPGGGVEQVGSDVTRYSVGDEVAIDALGLSDGDTVLVVGATGGVGSLAVQLAARAGATVVAPALAEDEAYLRELGVSELLPWRGCSRCAPRRCVR